MEITNLCIIIVGTIKRKKNQILSRAESPRTEQNCEKLNKKRLRMFIYIYYEKSVSPMDFAYVCIIIGGTIKKKSNLSRAESPCTVKEL